MEDYIFLELFEHVSFLLILVFLYDSLVDDFSDESPCKRQIISGTLIGSILIVTMNYGLHLDEGIFMDTRPIILSLTYIFFGPVSASIAIVTAILCRWYLGGEGMVVGIALIIFTASAGVWFKKYFIESLSQIKWVELYLLGFLVNSTMMLTFFLISWNKAFFIFTEYFFPIVIVYPLAQALIGNILVSRYQRQESLEAVKENAALFNTQFKSGGIGFAILGQQLQWIKVNNAFCQLLGYSEAELVTLSLRQLTPIDDWEEEFALYQQMLDEKIEKYEINKRFLKQDGSLVYVHLLASCRRSRGLIQSLVISVVDMTAVIDAERDIKVKEEHLNAIMKESHLGIWDWDLEQNVVEYNLQATKILNHSRQELEANVGFYLRDVHIDEEEQLKELFTNLISDQIDILQYEYRIIRLVDSNKETSQEIDSSLNNDEINYKWISIYAKVVERNLQNKVVKISGTLFDITPYKS